MADVVVMRDAKVYMHGYELTGQITSPTLSYGADALDRTALGDTTRARAGGLKTVAFSHTGFYEPGTLDPQVFSRIGTGEVPVSIGVDGADDGDLAYLFTALHTQYAPSGNVGELLGYNVTAEGDDDLVRGVVARNSTLLGSSNGTGTAFRLGSSTGKVVVAQLHVLAGTTNGSTEALVATLRSSASSGMSSPTTRITFTSASDVTAERQTFTAGTTDEWWQQTVTTPTSSAKFSVVMTAGLSTL